MLKRIWRDERGVSPVVEAVIMMLLFIGFFGGFSAYILGAHARSIVISAADVGARTASIECGLGTPTWNADAVTATETSLQNGGLHLVPGAASNQPGWYQVTVTGCPGTVTAQVQYNQVNTFPFIGPILGQGPQDAWTIPVQSTVVFPVE